MENLTVKLSPELDPRNQRTQLSIRQIRSERRVWYGLGIGVLLGSVLGLGLWWWQRVAVTQTDLAHDSLPEFGAEAPLTSAPLKLEAAPAAPAQDTEETEEDVQEVRPEAVSAANPAANTGAKPRATPRPAGGRSATAKSKQATDAEKKENRVWIKPEPERKVWLK